MVEAARMAGVGMAEAAMVGRTVGVEMSVMVEVLL